jgi:hypothetical protein
MVDERKPTLVSIPSDALRTLLDLRDEFPLFRQLLGDIVQTVMVLDASAIQGELRWRLGSRTNPTARTRLHEAIDSGVVIAFAPIFLRQEIEKYLPLIASETGVSVEAANAEWERVQRFIRFYAPTGDGAEFALVRCNRSRKGNLRRFVPGCSQYREQEQLCGAKLGEGIVTAQLVTINKKGA